LQANLEDDKKLPYRQWNNEGITAKSCKEKQKVKNNPQSKAQ